MKKERIMKNKSSRCPGSIRPMIYSIASALALMGAAANAATSEFAKVPLYLQNESQITEQPKVKHNIMLFIDDSYSMTYSSKNGLPIEARYGNTTHESRMKVAKRALREVLGKYGKDFNWALQTLNNSGGADTTDKEGFDVPAAEIANRVERINPYGGTPTTSRYFELVSQIVMPNVKYRCQKSYVVLMSDGDANLSCSLWDRRGKNLGGPDFRYGYDRYSTYYGKDMYIRNQYHNESMEYNKAYNYFGPRSHGFCQYEEGGAYDTSWDRNDGLAFFSKKLAEKDFKTEGPDDAGKSWNGDPKDPADYSKQLVQTFTVGFGQGISPSGKSYLQLAASRPEYYYEADKFESLSKAFNDIVEQIKSDTKNVGYDDVGATAPATTSSSLPGMSAVIGLKTNSWSSQIIFQRLGKDGRRSEELKQYPSFANRKTLINTDSGTYFINNIPNNTLNNAYFDIADNGKNSGEWSDLLNWTGRVGNDKSIQDKSKNTPYSQVYRIREGDQRDLGDILDGSVAAVGNKTKYKVGIDTIERQKYMVAAANDGMVHLFQTSSDANHPYELKVSYIPSTMERDVADGNNVKTVTLAKVLKNIAKDSYTSSITNHEYMINGGFTLRQTPENDTQRVFMFGAMGQGGRGAYALNIGGNVDKATKTGLDVADTEWNKTVPLFETIKGEKNTLGYTIGTPQIGRVSVNRPADNGRVDTKENIRYAGFLASGYRVEDKTDAKNETALYIYEMLGKEVGTGDKRGSGTGKAPGELLKKIEVEGGVGGLSTPTLVDTDFDGVIDVAYAGDRGGNMYRFDLRGEKPDNWKAVKIFTGSPSKPITSAPAVSRRRANEYVVIFGTGSEIYQNDLTNKDKQSIYGIYEDLTPNQTVTAASESDLQQQEFRPEEKGKEGYIYLTNNQVAKTQKGWKIDLRDGERVNVKPTMILRTAVVTVRRYDSVTEEKSAGADVCLPTSTSVKTVAKTSFIGVNADNGGALNARSARFTPDTVIRKLDGFGMQYANGLTQDGVINFTFLNPSKLDDSPVTADGDSGGTGTDKELSVTSSTPNNKCFSNKATRSLLLNKGESLTVEGRICGLQRISWRELFF